MRKRNVSGPTAVRYRCERQTHTCIRPRLHYGSRTGGPGTTATFELEQEGLLIAWLRQQPDPWHSGVCGRGEAERSKLRAVPGWPVAADDTMPRGRREPCSGTDRARLARTQAAPAHRAGQSGGLRDVSRGGRRHPLGAQPGAGPPLAQRLPRQGQPGAPPPPRPAAPSSARTFAPAAAPPCLPPAPPRHPPSTRPCSSDTRARPPPLSRAPALLILRRRSRCQAGAQDCAPPRAPPTRAPTTTCGDWTGTLASHPARRLRPIPPHQSPPRRHHHLTTSRLPLSSTPPQATRGRRRELERRRAAGAALGAARRARARRVAARRGDGAGAALLDVGDAAAAARVARAAAAAAQPAGAV